MELFYFAILVCVLLACKAELSKNKIWVVLIVLVLSLLAGLRGLSVGTDTQTYERMFTSILNGGSSNMEVGFQYISRFFLAIFGQTRPLHVIFAFIINGFIMARLWDFKGSCSFAFAAFLYMTVFYPQTMNVMRQMVAVALIFFATRVLEKRRYILYLIFVAIASSIHVSALISIIMLVPFIFGNENIKKGNKIISLLIIAILSPIVIVAYNILYNSYNGYMSGSATTGISKLMIFRVVILILFWVMTATHFGHIRPRENSRAAADTARFKMISIAYTLGIALLFAGLIYDYANRVASYFTIFEVVFGAMLTRRERKPFFCLLFIILALYFLVIKAGILGECGINPYTLYFME